MGEGDEPTAKMGAGWGRIGDKEISRDRGEEVGDGLWVKATTKLCR